MYYSFGIKWLSNCASTFVLSILNVDRKISLNVDCTLVKNKLFLSLLLSIRILHTSLQ